MEGLEPGRELEQRVAIVTGGAGGFGDGIARRLAAEGAIVIVCDVQADGAERVAASIRDGGGHADAAALDVGDELAWRTVTEEVMRRHGRIDILVNNAGINYRLPMMELTVAQWEQTLRVNLTGAFHGIRTVGPLMRDGGGGAMVNVSSIAGLVGHPDAPYSATKWALRGLAKTAALEFADWNIRVNSLHPGSVPTPLHQSAPPGHAAVWRLMTPMRRQGHVEEVGEAVLFLVSPRSSFMTGTEMVVDGGLSSCGVVSGRARLLPRFAEEE